MKRTDDFQERRAHLANLTDDQLEARFWELANKLVDPLLKMGYEYTSPAVERSVLLRMGFSSIEAKAIVDGCIEHNLIAHGAGNARQGSHLPTASFGMKLKNFLTEATTDERLYTFPR